MRDRLCLIMQYGLPQRFLSWFAGCLAESRWPWLKNRLILFFIKRYQVDVNSALLESLDEYPTYNSFFTRYLKPGLRPLVEGNNQIASPVDGTVSQLGRIDQTLLFQAKGFHYSLSSLLGQDKKTADLFENGYFATLYLAPRDYHRVHMPIEGRLIKTIYIPGKLFSVSQQTARLIPDLFALNERLVCVFETEIGPLCLILVGAMLVSSIQMVFEETPSYGKTITTRSFSPPIQLAKGQEVGHFRMGSTVIVLFGQDSIRWSGQLHENVSVKFGQLMAEVNERV